MINFLWKFAALTLVLFGGKEATRNMLFGLSYGMGWKRLFWNIWNKGRVKTVKPSGTVSQLTGAGTGVEPPYSGHYRRMSDEQLRDLVD